MKKRSIFLALGTFILVGICGRTAESQVRLGSPRQSRVIQFDLGGAVQPMPMPVQQTPEVKPDGEKPAGEKKDEKKDDEKSKDDGKNGAKPIARPAQPETPANPDELKVRPDEKGRVRFNFQGQPWQGVLEWLAQISDMSLDWQELPGDFLNLKTQRSYTVPEARDLVNRHLLDRGYTMLRHGEVLTIVSIKKLDPSLVPRVRPDELPSRDPHEFVKVTFSLDWLLAETTIEELKPLLSPNGKLSPLKTTNRVEAIDAVANLQDVYTLLREEQSKSGRKRLVKPFRLKHVRADEVKRHLQGLLGLAEDPIAAAAQAAAETSGPEMIGQLQAIQQAQMQAQQAAQQAAAAAGPSKPLPKVNMVVNQRENTLLVHASADQLAIIQEAIDVLDQPSDNPSLIQSMTRVRVYRLTNIDPEPIVKMLRELGGLEPTTRVQVDKKNRSLIVHGSLSDHLIIRQLVDKLDGSERKFEVVRLRKLEADYVAGTIEFMMVGEQKDSQQPSYNPFFGFDFSGGGGNQNKNNKFKVDADIENNRLLLWANDIELAEVEKLLIKLGEIPPTGEAAPRRRIIESISPDEAAEFLKRLKKTWPGVAPNPLQIDVPEAQDEPAPETERPKRHPGSIKTTIQTRDSFGSRPVSQQTLYPIRDKNATAARPIPTSIRSQIDSESTETHSPRLIDLDRQTERVAMAHRVDDVSVEKDYSEELQPEDEVSPQDDLDTAPEDANMDVPVQRKHPSKKAGPQSRSTARPFGMRKQSSDELEMDDVDDSQGQRRRQTDLGDAPVQIHQGPDGKLVIQSDDPEALDALEELVGKLAPVRRDFKVFKLKHSSTWAWGVAQNLKDFFAEKEKKSRSDEFFRPWWANNMNNKSDERRRLSKRRPLKFIPDNDSNSIIVSGADPQQLQIIEELIALYDVADSKDTKSMRITKMFSVKYGKARVIAETIKEVYRDLLSESDAALNGKGGDDKNKKPAPTMYTYVLGGGGDDDEGGNKPKTPVKLKGMLSIGVDEVSNTLIVSAAEGMMPELEGIIEALDLSARPTVSRVHVMQMGKQVNVGTVQDRMSKLLKRPTPPQQPNQQPQLQRNQMPQPQQQPGEEQPSVMIVD